MRQFQRFPSENKTLANTRTVQFSDTADYYHTLDKLQDCWASGRGTEWKWNNAGQPLDGNVIYRYRLYVHLLTS